MNDKGPPPRLGQPAPGLVWRKRLKSNEWVATWLARTDIIKRGYSPRSIELWAGVEPDEKQAEDIALRCQHQQFDMLTWGRELPPPENPLPDYFTGDLKSLIHCYRTDGDSPYQKNRFHVRKHRDGMLRRIGKRYGDVKLPDIKARLLMAWHKDWTNGGVKLATGSAYIGQLRALFSFGATLLEDTDCERLCGVMHKMRFPGTKARAVSLTADDANAIRTTAREDFGWPSISLAQALQFECTLRQKDIIGELVPLSEPGISDVILRDQKWLRGLRWEEIDKSLILRHITSKKQKMTEVDLKLAPMVLEELQILAGDEPLIVVDETTKRQTVNRQLLPTTGPVVLCDITAMPWTGNEYRRKWRLVARACGIPDNVFSMDSRTNFGNPYVIGDKMDMKMVRRWGWNISPEGQKIVCEDATMAVRRFAHALQWDEAIHDWVREKLGGKDLACWCRPDEPCHADVLLAIANSKKSDVRAMNDAADARIMAAAEAVTRAIQ